MWKSNERRLANGIYPVFSGTINSGLHLNKWLSRCRDDIYGDVIVLKLFGIAPPRKGFPDYVHVPEELCYPSVLSKMFEAINTL